MQVTIRKVSMEDAEILLGWTNDATVRANSIHPETVSWEDHVAWLRSKLDSSSIILILEVDSTPIGQIRFDYDIIQTRWILNYLIGNRYRGRGFGKIIVNMGMMYLNKYPIVAFVKPENIPSIKVFEGLAFVNEGLETMNQVDLIKFVKMSGSVMQKAVWESNV